MDMLEHEVRTLLSQRRKVEAVKQVREATGWGLKEAKDYVDAIEAGRTPPMMTADTSMVSQDTLVFEARELLIRGKKIEAVKKVRELSGWGLKEAKDFVDSLE